ncbi:YqaA family protein [Bartonella sp. CB175]|uniref:YqaA family protein n=1 Tax=Bartonella sp. CB175 TaxID=3112256 RepID=UPI00300E0E60
MKKPAILNSLRLWIISLANRRTAQYWLGFIAFVESSVFPVPADVLYIPMILARRNRAYYYALIATVCSILGGIVGWSIGHFAYSTIAKPILEFYGKYRAFEELHNNITLRFLVFLLILSGFFHFPPIKITTILAGVMNVHLGIFIITCIFARGARFYLIAWLAERFGDQIQNFISYHLKWIILIGCITLLLVYVIFTTLLNQHFLL